MVRYRRVPLLVDAYQNLTGSGIYLRTEHGTVCANPTDWIITGCLSTMVDLSTIQI